MYVLVFQFIHLFFVKIYIHIEHKVTPHINNKYVMLSMNTNHSSKTCDLWKISKNVTESLKPETYSLALKASFVNSVPCHVVAKVTAGYQQLVSGLRCMTDHSRCRATVSITGCVTRGRRKRNADSELLVTFYVPLTNTDHFDLSSYYRTLNSESSYTT